MPADSRPQSRRSLKQASDRVPRDLRLGDRTVVDPHPSAAAAGSDAGCQLAECDAFEPGIRASRPEEFHPRPLTGRCGSLSTHTAPTKQPTASLPPRSPPVASWTLKTTAWPNPFAPAA